MDTYVQLMKNKSAEQCYEKHPAIKCTRKNNVSFFLLTRIELEGSHDDCRNGDEKEYKRKDEKKALHRRRKDT